MTSETSIQVDLSPKKAPIWDKTFRTSLKHIDLTEAAFHPLIKKCTLQALKFEGYLSTKVYTLMFIIN